MEDLKKIAEALLFSSDQPLSVNQIKEIVPESSPQAIQAALEALKNDYQNSGRAFSLEEIAGGYRILTRPECAEWVQRLFKKRSETKLSAAALEILAVIAYKQPVKRADVESIRGVQSGQLIRALMERGLVKIEGREDVPGAPLMYGTTKTFLDVFGLKAIEDLPRPEEVK